MIAECAAPRRDCSPVVRRRGLGATAAQDINVGATLATPVAGAVAGGSVATALGISTAVAVPLIGAAIAGIALGIEAILNSGCGKSCVITSNWANQAEALLVQNVNAYFAQPVPRSQSSQTAALANFDRVWNYLVQQCSQVAGGAGTNCIQDRQAGACKWKQTSSSPLLSIPGEPQPGQCWNWFSGYRDVISQDPNVVPDSALLTSSVGSDVSAGASQVAATVQSLTTSPLGMIAVLAAAGLALWSLS